MIPDHPDVTPVANRTCNGTGRIVVVADGWSDSFIVLPTWVAIIYCGERMAANPRDRAVAIKAA